MDSKVWYTRGIAAAVLLMSVALVAIASAGCGSQADAAPGPLKLGEADNGKAHTVRVGDTIEVIIPGNMTTGFSWAAALAERCGSCATGRRTGVRDRQHAGRQRGHLHPHLHGCGQGRGAAETGLRAAVGDRGPREDLQRHGHRQVAGAASRAAAIGKKGERSATAPSNSRVADAAPRHLRLVGDRGVANRL
jgi:hypothetical protein